MFVSRVRNQKIRVPADVLKEKGVGDGERVKAEIEKMEED